MGRSDYRTVVSSGCGGEVVVLFDQTIISPSVCSPERNANSYAFYILQYGTIYHDNYLSFDPSISNSKQPERLNHERSAVIIMVVPFALVWMQSYLKQDSSLFFEDD